MAPRSAALARLTTLADSPQRAQQKWEMEGRVAEKKAVDIDEGKLERQCLKIVWKRDEGKCRACGCTVIKSLDRAPNRGETHHIAGRADYAVKFDPRNRVLVCALCHEKLELLKLFIIATVRQIFKVGGKSYINGDKHIQFKEKAA